MNDENRILLPSVPMVTVDLLFLLEWKVFSAPKATTYRILGDLDLSGDEFIDM